LIFAFPLALMTPAILYSYGGHSDFSLLSSVSSRSVNSFKFERCFFSVYFGLDYCWRLAIAFSSIGFVAAAW